MLKGLKACHGQQASHKPAAHVCHSMIGGSKQDFRSSLVDFKSSVADCSSIVDYAMSRCCSFLLSCRTDCQGEGEGEGHTNKTINANPTCLTNPRCHTNADSPTDTTRPTNHCNPTDTACHTRPTNSYRKSCCRFIDSIATQTQSHRKLH